MACRKGSRDCGDACSVRGGGVRSGGVRCGVTCGASYPLLSTAPFVQESWRKDLGEGGRERVERGREGEIGEREGGRERVERGREGGREGGREWREGGREGGNE